MKLEFDDGKLETVTADALAVPVFKDETPDTVAALVAPLRDAGLAGARRWWMWEVDMD
ncbi:MAG: hypothetical protein ABGW95_01790 [Candidatus Poseidoniia archaeon]